MKNIILVVFVHTHGSNDGRLCVELKAKIAKCCCMEEGNLVIFVVFRFFDIFVQFWGI